MSMTQAALVRLADAASAEVVERYEGFQAGGGGMVAKAAIVREGVRAVAVGDDLVLTFARPGAYLEAAVPVLELPEQWQGYDRLMVVLTNGDAPCEVEVAIIGARCRLPVRRGLEAGADATIAIDLIDLPLTAGIRPVFQPAGVRVTATWSEGGAPRAIAVHSLGLRMAADEHLVPCVDRFGQRVNATWPGKLVREDEWPERIAAENTLLGGMTPLPDLDVFGGWAAGPAFEATGFFRVAQDDGGRWWYVDPIGQPFWSIGPTCIRSTDATPIAGREFLFEELPDPDGAYADAYLDGNLAIYRWNVLRKWGSLDKWRARVLGRLARWGMNTVANWSEPAMLEQFRLPHTRSFRSRVEQGPVVGQRFPDVFDPRWAALLDTLCAEHAAPHADNPWLMGYFVDNELPWTRMRLLDAPADAALRDAWLDFAGTRYHNVGAFNQAWGTSCGDWAAVRALTNDAVPAEGSGAEDMRAFETHYAQTYFRLIARALKAQDPNHLYMGCRFVRMPPHAGIVAAAGRYADAMSVNCYAITPDRDAFTWWHETSGKPIVIGEHHLPLDSPRQLPPLYRNFTAEERRLYYVRFIQDWAKMPFSLGAHWFQHADQPLTGRVSDGENQLIGLVDITDEPHMDLVDAIREATAGMYAWHLEG